MPDTRSLWPGKLAGTSILLRRKKVNEVGVYGSPRRPLPGGIGTAVILIGDSAHEFAHRLAIIRRRDQFVGLACRRRSISRHLRPT